MPRVAIVNIEDKTIEETVRHAIDLTGGLIERVPAGSTVLIKPNLVTNAPSGSGIITDARVTEAVTRLVLESNAQRVIIGEGASVGYDFPGRKDSMHCMEASGTADAARRLGVEMVDLNRDERVEVRPQDAFVMNKFSVARTAWEADVIVCLPVIKTHVRTGITCSLKNMKGVLPGDEKKRSHRLGLDRAIVDLNRVVKPDFTVVDGIVGMEGANVYPEDCVPLGRIISGPDAVAVDKVCATLAGFDVDQILHVKLAAEEGLGVAELDQIQVCGDTIAEASRRFVPYQEAARDRFAAATIVEKDACTGCMGEMVSTFIYLEKAGFKESLADLTLVLGSPTEVQIPDSEPVIIGKCAQAYRELGVFVPGCPPHGFKITEGACRALGKDQDIVHRSIAELHDF